MARNLNKKQLQEQVHRLTNEIEELRLEREESKKNVLHFMQESDSIRQELKRAQEIIEELSLKEEEKGYNSPPPESDNDDDDHAHSSNPTKKKKVSLLFSKLSLLEEDQISTLLQLVEGGNSIDNLKNELDQTRGELSQAKSDNTLLKEELDQLNEEYQATRGALQVENDRAEIMETRWKESENNLEQAEYTIQSLKKELEKRLEWITTNNTQPPSDNNSSVELCKVKEDLDLAVDNYNQCKLNLQQAQSELKQYEQNNTELKSKNSTLESILKEEATQAKIRETHLKTVNKTLREEIRKKNKVEEEIINVEYLRNVIIKFLERKSTRPQLVPVLSTLLKCSKDEQTRLNKLTSRKIVL